MGPEPMLGRGIRRIYAGKFQCQAYFSPVTGIGAAAPRSCRRLPVGHFGFGSGHRRARMAGRPSLGQVSWVNWGAARLIRRSVSPGCTQPRSPSSWSCSPSCAWSPRRFARSSAPGSNSVRPVNSGADCLGTGCASSSPPSSAGLAPTRRPASRSRFIGCVPYFWVVTQGIQGILMATAVATVALRVDTTLASLGSGCCPWRSPPS